MSVFRESSDDHVLTVTAVREPEGEFDDGELEYEIEHPESCPRELFGWAGHEYEDWNCAVAGIIRDSGLAFALKYSGTPVTKPGRYVIRAWFSRYTSMDFIGYEYDDGIGIVDED